MGGLRTQQGAGGCVQRGLGNKALIDQGAVVVELTLGDVYLGFGCVGLFLGLLNSGLVLGGIHTGDHLPGLYPVTLTQAQSLQLPRHLGFDHG